MLSHLKRKFKKSLSSHKHLPWCQPVPEKSPCSLFSFKWVSWFGKLEETTKDQSGKISRNVLWGLGKSRQAEAYRGEWLLETNYFWILGPKLGTGIRNSWYLGTGIWEWKMSSGLLGMGMRRWYSREWSGTGITFNFNLICPRGGAKFKLVYFAL